VQHSTADHACSALAHNTQPATLVQGRALCSTAQQTTPAVLWRTTHSQPHLRGAGHCAAQHSRPRLQCYGDLRGPARQPSQQDAHGASPFRKKSQAWLPWTALGLAGPISMPLLAWPLSPALQAFSTSRPQHTCRAEQTLYYRLPPPSPSSRLGRKAGHIAAFLCVSFQRLFSVPAEALPECWLTLLCSLCCRGTLRGQLDSGTKVPSEAAAGSEGAPLLF